VQQGVSEVAAVIVRVCLHLDEKTFRKSENVILIFLQVHSFPV
jgi:hypothetical protein